MALDTYHINTDKFQAASDLSVKLLGLGKIQPHQSFGEKLKYLAQYSNGPGGFYPIDQGKDTKCVLYPDRAEHSFEFIMYYRETLNGPWVRWFNGGLNYHEGSGWSVNT